MSRQFEHLQEASLKRLQAMIPHDVMLVVRRADRGPRQGGFAVNIAGSDVGLSGRFEVVAAWIDGYLEGRRI